VEEGCNGRGQAVVVAQPGMVRQCTQHRGGNRRIWCKEGPDRWVWFGSDTGGNQDDGWAKAGARGHGVSNRKREVGGVSGRVGQAGTWGHDLNGSLKLPGG
jgi:hypothetical protein